MSFAAAQASAEEGEALSMRDVAFAYPSTGFQIRIESFRLHAGENIFLRGPSGSGKTTFLSLATGLLAADGGEIVVAGKKTPKRAAARDALRAKFIGIIHQQFNLLSYLDTLSNVLLPFAFGRGFADGDERHKASELLTTLGVPQHLHKAPARALSVGQQQRVAIARALIGRPALVVADEPTSALDVETRDAFLDILFDSVNAAGSTLLMVSHDPVIGQRFDHAIDLRDVAKTEIGTVS
ncbi:ATP-binding cassette domain-containing protein [Pseudahrensia aquimaris]|uniref:ATP-binding cassette domain-containing protein n=1 Tax=Pseudahrensia aquimaris TaxID=744461 RepID=A0ABW3FHC3_9HYPH